MQSNNLDKKTLRTIRNVMMALIVLMPLGAFGLALLWLTPQTAIGFALLTLIGMVLLTVVVQNTIRRA